MRAGGLVEWAIFQEPEEYRDASGEPLEWWETIASKFVQSRAIGIAEREAISRTLEGERARYVMHYMDGITIRGRMLVDELAYSIEQVVDRDEKHREMDVYVRSDIAFYPLFSYRWLATQEISAGTYEFRWTTDAFASSKVRHREVGTVPWTETVHAAARSLSHSRTASGFVAGKTYEFQAYGENIQGKSPSWSMSKQWTVPASGTLHIMNVAFDTATKGRIGVSYTTNENAKCAIYGSPYPIDDFVEWYANATEHISPHAHAKTGVALGRYYAVNIQCVTDEGLTAWAPSAGGYYVVKTSDEGGGMGGLIMTVM